MRLGRYFFSSLLIITTLYIGVLVLITLTHKDGTRRDEDYVLPRRVKPEKFKIGQNRSIIPHRLDSKYEERRDHVRQVCHKHGLDKKSDNYKANAWEFLVNKEHGLVWCNIFKAASSTWFYNFNLLAGYPKQQLDMTRTAPVQLARKYYKRYSVDELQEVLHHQPHPVSFMITRHPLERLVSYYRNKFFDKHADSLIKRLCKTIVTKYPWIPVVQSDGCGKNTPSFLAFASHVVDYFTPHLLESGCRGPDGKLDAFSMHWVPMNSYCTPCLVDFSVYAKVETMDEDGNYIIEKSGITDLIKLSEINKSIDQKKRYEEADILLCQLTEDILLKLIKLYQYDIDLFQYDVTKYINCTKGR